MHKRFLLGMFSDRLFVAGKMYREFVADEDSPEILSFFGKKNLASLFGSVDFIQWIKEKYYLSMYLGRKLAGLSLAELGIAFDSKKYSSVGSVVLRLERKLSDDKQLSNKVNTLRAKLIKL